jgi:hypothetical protein
MKGTIFWMVQDLRTLKLKCNCSWFGGQMKAQPNANKRKPNKNELPEEPFLLFYVHVAG